MYRVNRFGDLLELRAATPSLGEAASDSEFQYSDRREIVIRFKVVNDEAVPIEAYVDDGVNRRPLTLDEINWWLNVIENL